jgi:hypothetical protein
MNESNVKLVSSESPRRLALPCVFWDDVLCSFRKYENVKILSRCFNCSHYKRFMDEMEEEDRKIDAEIAEIHRTGVHD